MRHSTAASRLLVISILAALTASLVGTTAVGARDGQSTARQLRSPSQPDRQAAGQRPYREIEVDRLPAASDAGVMHDSPLRRPEASFPGAAPDVQAVAPPPVQSTTNGDPVVDQARAFNGLSQAETGHEPPGPWVAVGPEHVVQAVNRTFRISDRSGTAIDTVDMFAFFGLDGFYEPGEVEFFDPRVIYDSLHARWVAVEASFDCFADADPTSVGTGYLDVAISDGPDPTGGWGVVSIPYPDAIPDYPGIGTSTDKVVVSANAFALAPDASPIGCGATDFVGTEMDVMAWSELMGTGDIFIEYLYSSASFPNEYFSWRPALQTPATSATVFAIAERFDGTDLGWGYARITGTPAGGGVTSISVLPDLTLAGVISHPVEPPQPKQPGAPPTIVQAVDERPTDAVWKDNRLLFVSTHGCDPNGGIAEIRDCVRVSELSTATPASPTLIQDFLVAEEGADLYTGGIGYALNNDLHVVWTRSSAAAGAYPSTYAAYQSASAANNAVSARALIAAGTGTYPGTRWGAYVGVGQDPQVLNAVWQANAYSVGAAGWATEVTQLQTGGTTYVPITPVRVLDTRPGAAVGLSGTFAHGVARSWTVGGFDPPGAQLPIPTNAIAVTGNLTVTGQTSAGYVSVTPAPNNNPASSTINFPLGDNRANNVTIPVNADRKISAVYRAAAGKTTHLIFDVTGYFVAGGGQAEYKTISPVRALDTRPGGTGLSGPFQKDVPRKLSIGPAHVPAAAVAITGNLTVTGQTGPGYLSITPVSDSTPDTSNLNFPLGDNRANGFVAPLDAADDLWIVYKTGAAGPRSAHVILDVTGYFVNDPTGMRFFPLTPGRTLDSRPGASLTGLTGFFNASSPRKLEVGSRWGVPSGAGAITGNLTAVGQSAAGYVSVTLANNPVPTTSNLNFPLGDTRANGLTVPLFDGSDIWLVYKAAAGKRTHLILDVSGYFD